MDYIFKYRGETVLPYDRSYIYDKKSYVEYEGKIFKSTIDLNMNHVPTSNSSYWKQIERIGYGYTEDWKVEDWEEDKLYTKYDKVKYQGLIYMCDAGRLTGSTPPSESIWWKKCGSYNDGSDKKSTIIKINNDRAGDIIADNVVIYGNHTGDISANGEKSVVVVFGDVTGDITANQVIRLDKQNIMKTIKTPELPIKQEY